MEGEWDVKREWENQRVGGTSARIRPLWEEALKGCSPTVHLFITELMAFKDGGAGTEPAAVFFPITLHLPLNCG